MGRYDLPAPRYTSYPTVPYWTQDFGPADYANRLTEAGRGGLAQPLSIYIHIPFCREMCTFCGCNVVIAKDARKADPYLEHVRAEMALAAKLLGERRQFAQLHYGGGTPTFLDEERLGCLWEGLREHFEPTADAELAIEVDPVVTSREQLALLASQGFNRLSLGVQDFDPTVQRAINRIQSVEQTHTIITDARALGFRGINVDLIYGLPHQQPESWQRTLDQILLMRPDRAAVYSFAYLPDLRGHQRKLAQDSIPFGVPKLALFAMAYDAFVGAGYRAIGMDHFALADDELALAQARRVLSRSFQGYTVRRADDVVAFGATGISDVAAAYAQSVRPLPRYYAAVDSGNFAIERGVRLTADDRRRRQVITQIMCNFWVDLGPEGATTFARELDALRSLEQEGLVRLSGTEIELTGLGRVFVRNVAMVFDAYLQKEQAKPRFSATV